MLEIISMLLPFGVVFAADLMVPYIMQTVISWVAGLGGGIVAIFLVVSLVKDGIGFAKGDGNSSIWKIVGKALFLILIIGLIYLATNYDDLGKKSSSIADNAINQVESESNNILKNGNGTGTGTGN